MSWALALLLAPGATAGPAREEFVTPPDAGQLQAREAVVPPHLEASGALSVWTLGLMAGEGARPSFGPLPDFAAYREITERKQRFFDYLLPVVRVENERLSGIRTRLSYIREYTRWHRRLTSADRRWLEAVSDAYGLAGGDPMGAGFWSNLLERVDTLPEDLVLVQAANESGWGTSRFAREGNNLFGQWCFSEGCGIVPNDRPAGATYEVARYASVSESVGSYMHNLNTGRTYRKLREMRARMRREDSGLDAAELATGLRDYSARGMDYVVELRAMIRHNEDILHDLRASHPDDGNG